MTPSRPRAACVPLSASHCTRYSADVKTIQVRNVPDDVHRVLCTRAAGSGLSLSDFALGELARVARRPAVSEVLRCAGQRAGGADGVAIIEAMRSGRDRRCSERCGGSHSWEP